jgi:glycosyltransferase involved in cell wall biosynthesis
MHKDSVIFYTQNRWAYGQIHHALIKRLWEHRIYAHLLDWTVGYTYREFELLNNSHSTFVTTPEAVPALVNSGIPLHKIVAVAHAEKDIAGCISYGGIEIFEGLKGYGVVHSDLVKASATRGVARVPTVVRVGIDFDQYYSPISDNLKVVGYAGELEHKTVHNIDCKRAYLVDRVMQQVALEFKRHEFFNHLCMPGYYPTIDAIIVPSTSETAGLPAMEAAAAGRLVLSTEVGYFDGRSGALCRMADDEFVADAVNTLQKCTDPRIYREFCERGQQFAKDNYDWEYSIDDWANLITRKV